MLALVAVAALSPVYVTSAQDVSRLCLTRALVRGHVDVDGCLGGAVDRARHGGRTYSDKAPGVSVLAVPAAEAVRLPPPRRWTFEGDPRLWLVRLATSGLAFVLLAFAVGRVAEGLAAGTGGPTLVTFALGTLVAPLAATTFGHVLAAALAFGAFALAWRGRTGLAGLAAGSAVAVEYQTALVGVVLAAYVLVDGRRELARYAAGAVPPLALLAAYDWAAFGSPFHLSYRYVSNAYAPEQQSGFFGIHSPQAHAAHEVFLGGRGLLWLSPVLVAAAAGLALLARRHLGEALVCAAVTALFLLANCGYFLPYGGVSPGPRFVVPALPFLALGLAPAFASWRLPVVALAALSIVATTTVTLTWAMAGDRLPVPWVWDELARLPRERGSSRLVSELAKNALVWAGPSRLVAAALVAACAAAAFLLAVAPRAPRRGGSSRRG